MSLKQGPGTKLKAGLQYSVCILYCNNVFILIFYLTITVKGELEHYHSPQLVVTSASSPLA